MLGIADKTTPTLEIPPAHKKFTYAFFHFDIRFYTGAFPNCKGV